MADDSSQDKTQTTTEPTQQPIIPPTDQPLVETPPTQQPEPEQTANPVPSETETSPTTPTPPNSPSPVPVSSSTPEPQQTEPQTPETPQSTQAEQSPITPPTETQTPVVKLDIPALHYPFSGNFPVTFSFGQQSDNEEIKKKFQEWGVVGHNGLDFGLSAGNEVFACDAGKVIQSGDNGDFGTSITIQHSWGQSIYGHLQETKVKEGEEIFVNKVLGLSGSSGAAFGEHLHFAVKPNNPDIYNGYLGFIDPAPYLSLSSQKEEAKPPEPITPQPEVKQEQTKREESQQPPVEEVPPPIKLEPEKPIEQPIEEQPQQPESPQSPQTSQSSAEEIQKQVEDPELDRRVDEKLKVELDARRQKANEVRAKKKTDNLNRILGFTREKKVVTNDDVRDLLHISQSTATNYLSELVNRGMLKKEGDRGGAKYSI